MVNVLLIEVANSDSRLQSRLTLATAQQGVDIVLRSLGYVLEEMLDTTLQAAKDVMRTTREAVELASRQPAWMSPLQERRLDEVEAFLKSHTYAPHSREQELAEVFEALDESADGAGIALVGNSFVGKTTLVCELLRRCRESRPSVAFFNVRDAGQSRSACLRSLNTQLMHSLSIDLPLESEGALVQQFQFLLLELAATGPGVVVLVDALDEASDRGVQIEALAFRPHGVSFVVTTRPYPAFPRRLPSFQRRLDILEIPASRARKSEAQAWADDLVVADREHTIEVFAVLAAARGPLMPVDIGRFWDISTESVNGILSAHLQWLSPGSTAEEYRLGHDELSTLLNRQEAIRRADADAKLHTWAATFAAAGWPSSNTPIYLLKNWPRHVADAGERAMLICGEWTQSALMRLDGPQSVLGAAQLTVTELAELYVVSGSGIGTLTATCEAARCVQEMTDAVFPELIEAFVQFGETRKALDYALTSRNLNVVRVAYRCPDLYNARRELHQHAVRVLSSEEMLLVAEGWWPTLIDDIASDSLASAEATASAVQGARCRALAFTALVPHLARERGLVSAVRTIRTQLATPRDRMEAWKSLLPYVRKLDSISSKCRRLMSEIQSPEERANAWSSYTEDFGIDEDGLLGIKSCVATEIFDANDQSTAWCDVVRATAKHDWHTAIQIIRDDIAEDFQRNNAWQALVDGVSRAGEDALLELARARPAGLFESGALAGVAFRLARQDWSLACEIIEHDRRLGVANEELQWSHLISTLADRDVGRAIETAQVRIHSPASKSRVWRDIAGSLAKQDPVKALRVVKEHIRDCRGNITSAARGWLGAGEGGGCERPGRTLP